MPTCSAGHPSESTDYCDVCGMPLDAPTSAAPPPAAPGGDSAPCPNCSTQNPPDSLFCEACGYDYTTGAMPRGAQPANGRPGTPDAESTPDASGTGRSSDRPSGPDQPGTAEAGASSAGVLDLDAPLPEVASQAGPQPPAAPESSSAPDSAAAPAGSAEQSPVPDIDFEWIAEVWVDPEWYQIQQPPDPIPSPGLPQMVPLRKRTLLIGRPSRSRGISPDIDCDPDSGISRRQTQLTTDGRRWFVEDLDSSNGTYVAPAAGPLPRTPIPRGRRELDADDRLYLGAWTRIVLRRATPEEKELYS